MDKPVRVKPRLVAWRRSLPVAAIITLALVLRVAGADWGLPGFCNSDEHRTVEAAAKMAAKGSWDPEFYHWPNHVTIYLNAALYPTASKLRFAAPLSRSFRPNATYYLYLSRILAALMGAAAVAVAYAIGAHFRRDVGLVVAGLFAFFSPYVEHSHYASPDMPLTLFVLLVILLALRFTKRPSWANLLGMCAAAALATGTKYPGVATLAMVAGSLAVVHHHEPRRLLARGLVAAASFLAFVFVFTPYLLLRLDQVRSSILHESKTTHLGADGLSWLGNMDYYARSFLGASGALLLAFAVFGAVVVVRREGVRAFPLFFGLLYWVALSSLPLHWERWAQPMYAAPLLLSAFGMVAAVSEVRRVGRRRALALAGAWVAVVLSTSSIVLSGTVKTLSATLQDTRFASLAFLKERGITREEAVYDGATPFNPGSGPGAFQEVSRLGGRVRYVILSEYMYGRYLDAPHGYEDAKALYRQGLALPLVAEFAPTPARHRLEVIDVDEQRLQDWRAFELATIAEGFRYIASYLGDRRSMLAGPTIRIHMLPGEEN